MPRRRACFVVLWSIGLCAVRGARADTPHADVARAKQLAARGDCRSAIPIFEQAYQADPRPSTLLDLARCHEKTGDRDTAAAYYRTVAAGDDPAAAAEARQALDATAGTSPGATVGTASRSTQSIDAEAADETLPFGLAGGPLVAVPMGTAADAVKTSFGFGGRVGPEWGSESFLFCPAFRLDYLHWRVEDPAVGHVKSSWVHLGVDARLTWRSSAIAVFGSVGYGADVHHQTAQSWNLGGGASRRVGGNGAIGGALYVHKGESFDVSGFSTEYVALQLEASLF
jgi:hypothetical protein